MLYDSDFGKEKENILLNFSTTQERAGKAYKKSLTLTTFFYQTKK
jgi:hypothetical protein